MFNKRFKILVETDPSEWHGMSGELLWATRLKDGSYRLDNSPLYAYSLSMGDRVKAVAETGGILKFDGLLSRGGHSNYRILLKPGFLAEDFRKRWAEIQNLGCSYESSKDPEDVFAIDVPPESDVVAVYDVLERGVTDGLWHLDEGNFEHKLQ